MSIGRNLSYLMKKQATLGRPKILYTKAPQLNIRLQETYINLGMIAELEGNVAET
jgi:hypothetical protein